MLACQDPTEREEKEEEEPTCVGGLVCLMALVDIAWSLVVVVSCRLLPLSLCCATICPLYTLPTAVAFFCFSFVCRRAMISGAQSYHIRSFFFVPPPGLLILSFCSFPLLLPLCVCV